MRLIDADAEIKKIEEEIKRSYKAIDRWRSGGMPGSSLYDIDEKVRRIKRRKPGRKKDGYNQGKSGPNGDRHLCKTCMYRGRRDQTGNCSYIEIVGHRRGMPAERCTVYKEGRKRRQTTW